MKLRWNNRPRLKAEIFSRILFRYGLSLRIDKKIFTLHFYIKILCILYNYCWRVIIQILKLINYRLWIEREKERTLTFFLSFCTPYKD